MSIRRAKNIIICDTESERNLQWGNGQEIFCKDTNKNYIINNGNFVLINGAGGSGLEQYQVRRIIRR